jgi:transcriptional regulator with XRE-family HTH domain
MTYANPIKSYREAMGLTQRQLAIEAGVSKQSVTNAEQGVFRNPEVLNLLAAFFGVTPEQVLEADPLYKMRKSMQTVASGQTTFAEHMQVMDDLYQELRKLDDTLPPGHWVTPNAFDPDPGSALAEATTTRLS